MGHNSMPIDKLLACVYSNSTFAGGELAANFRKPFDMIAETNDEYRKKKATSPKKSGYFEIWRPQDNDLDNWEISFDFGILGVKDSQL